MFQTELARAITDPGLGTGVITTTAPAARGGRVIAPAGPHPPQLGGDSPVYDDGVLRITRLPGTGPGAGPGPGLGAGPGPGLGAGYALAGEIDESTVGGLSGKLAEIAAGLDEVHLDLAALDYSDLAGLRVIVQLTADGRRHVVLHHVPAHLRAIMGIVGWDTAPGVELAS